MITPARRRRIKQVVAQRQKGLVVVLEDIHDPHNAAAVFRSADGFGVQEVFLIFNQEKYFNPKRIGKASSASANKWLDFKTYRSVEACFKQLKKQGFCIVATVAGEKAESIFTARFKEDKIALVFGNEHRGLSFEAVELADRKITIPMRGMVQSLNLSVTAAICLFEVTRQRLRRISRYKLTARKQRVLQRKFFRR